MAASICRRGSLISRHLPLIKDAACAAINADVNQYAVTWGARPLREAVAREFTRRYGLPIVADQQVTVCCGSTEAMMSTMMAIIDPGDEVVVFEPFYENYGPDAILSGATPRYVTLHEPTPSTSLGAGWSFDPDELAAAFNDKTKAIIINTPNNPTGKVFSREELETIAALCRKWDAIAISDEIYEHIIYDGLPHVPIATIDGMADRTVTINGLSKTYSVTGWRVGWTISPPTAHGCDTQGARFPHRGRARAVAGSRRRGARPARRVLRQARARIPAAPRCAARHPRAPSLHLLQARRRVLHHDRHPLVRIQGRCRVRALPGERCRRRDGAREQLLQDVERRADQDPLLFLQERRNLSGS
jgi:histidinol-phosphate/aromatic aminotransferase/cobyric acid decarboxylase-like protein